MKRIERFAPWPDPPNLEREDLMAGRTTAEIKDITHHLVRIVEELCVHGDLMRKQNELLEDVAEGIAQLVKGTAALNLLAVPDGYEDGAGIRNMFDWTRPSKRKKEETR